MSLQVGTESDEVPRLRNVNSNTPVLVHSSSQRSITASDDYYSVSDASVSQASSDDRTTVIRYHTPSEGLARGAQAVGNASEPAARAASSGKRATSENAEPPAAPGPLEPHHDGPEGLRTPTGRGSEEALPAAVQLPIQGAPLPHPPAEDKGLPVEEATTPASTAPAFHHEPVPEATDSESCAGLLAAVPAAASGAAAGAAIAHAEPHPPEPPKPPFAGPESERSVESPLPQAPGAYPNTSTVRFAEEATTRTIPRRPVGSGNSAEMAAWEQSRTENTPTPGADDTPYIHFAIDQLTRDEELLGRSRDPRGSPNMTPVPPSALGAPEVSPMSSDDEQRGRSRRQERELETPTQAAAATIPPAAAAVEPKRRSRSVSPLSDQHPAPQPSETQDPAQRPHQEERITSRLPPHDLYRYPPLTFIPSSLRLPAIFTLILCCMILIALLTTSVVWTAKRGGLWNYDGTGTARYFLAQNLPPFLAVLFILGVQFSQRAVQRILPFVLLSHKPATSERNIFYSVPLVITNFLLPTSSWFHPGELALAYAAFSLWLNLFTVPLASALYQTRLYNPDMGTWKWTTVQPIGVVLISLYLNLILSLLALHFRLRRHPTGLKWDPTSPADLFVLLRQSSTRSSPLIPQRASLGYWESPSQPGHFYHGFGDAPATAKLEINRGKTVLRPQDARGLAQASTFESWRSTKGTKLRPWFLRESVLALFATIAVVLMVAFIVISYLHGALSFGFNPLLLTATADTTSFQAFSPSNFVFSFVPAIVGLLAALCWAPIDASARLFAPYISLLQGGTGRPLKSNETLLLSYGSDSSLKASLRAINRGDFYVAAAALLKLSNWALPILGGGIFTAQYVMGPDDNGQIVMRADAGGLAALTAFVVIGAMGWLAAWPVTGRLLRGGWTAGGARARTHDAKGKAIDVEKGHVDGSRPTTGSRSSRGATRDGPAAPPARASTVLTGDLGAMGGGGLDHFLCGADLRYLGGIQDALGVAMLSSTIWREPRSKADLVSRLMTKGQGRWSWQPVASDHEGATAQHV